MKKESSRRAKLMGHTALVCIYLIGLTVITLQLRSLLPLAC